MPSATTTGEVATQAVGQVAEHTSSADAAGVTPVKRTATLAERRARAAEVAATMGRPVDHDAISQHAALARAQMRAQKDATSNQKTEMQLQLERQQQVADAILAQAESVKQAFIWIPCAAQQHPSMLRAAMTELPPDAPSENVFAVFGTQTTLTFRDVKPAGNGDRSVTNDFYDCSFRIEGECPNGFDFRRDCSMRFCGRVRTDLDQEPKFADDSVSELLLSVGGALVVVETFATSALLDNGIWLSPFKVGHVLPASAPLEVIIRVPSPSIVVRGVVGFECGVIRNSAAFAGVTLSFMTHRGVAVTITRGHAAYTVWNLRDGISKNTMYRYMVDNHAGHSAAYTAAISRLEIALAVHKKKMAASISAQVQAQQGQGGQEQRFTNDKRKSVADDDNDEDEFTLLSTPSQGITTDQATASV